MLNCSGAPEEDAIAAGLKPKFLIAHIVAMLSDLLGVFSCLLFGAPLLSTISPVKVGGSDQIELFLTLSCSAGPTPGIP